MPLAISVKDALPDVAHILVLIGWVTIATDTHVEVTVTVKVKVAPVHIPDTGVTVYIAVPVPDGFVSVPLIVVCGTGWALPPVTLPV